MIAMKIKNVFAVAVLVLLTALNACQYEYVIPDIPQIDPEVPVKFSEQIVPIFTNSDNCTACHKTGATAPDLTAGNAYNALVPAFVNTTDPEASNIYWYANPASSTHGWKKLTAAEAALILTWIKQGAENN
jgi:hypothetical protein